MSGQPTPIIPGQEPSQSDLALVKLWSELEKGQLDILDQANKRIIEMVTGLLAVFLAVVAFGKDFPQEYLKAGYAPYLAAGIIALFLLALLSAAIGLQPREYRKYEHNLTEMRSELNKMVGYKKRWYQFAMWLFAAGSVLLGILIVAAIVQETGG